MKSSITHTEYLELLGLKVMALRHNAALEQMIHAGRVILDDDPGASYGDFDDVMYSSSQDVDGFLRQFKVAVEPPMPAAAAEYFFMEEERAAALAVVQAAKAQGWPEAAKLADLERALEVTP